MSWKDIIYFCIIVLGIVLFLYGSNVYYALWGWIGIALIIGGLVMKAVLGIYSVIRKKRMKVKNCRVLSISDLGSLDMV